MLQWSMGFCVCKWLGSSGRKFSLFTVRILWTRRQVAQLPSILWQIIKTSSIFFPFFFSFLAKLINNSHQGNSPGPSLFSNVSCNSSHSNLFQCFDLQNIGTGIHNCQHNEVTGVSCQQIPDNITATSVVVFTTVTPTTVSNYAVL